MKARTLFLVSAASVALVNVGHTVSLADGSPAANAPGGAPQAPDSDQMKALRDAKDPSAAIEAYAAAVIAHPGDVAVPAAYLRKMVEFGLPEMTEKQALEVSQRDPANGLAWAVLAYMDARHEKTTPALEKVCTAVSRNPEDPFVLRTAGQLAAWYDTRANKDEIPSGLRDSVERMRTSIAARAGFSDPYRMAREAYSQPAQDAGAAPQGEPSPPAPGASPRTVEPAPRSSGLVEEVPPGDLVREETIIVERDPPLVERVYVPETTYVYERSYVYTDPFIGCASPFVCDPWWPAAFTFRYDNCWSRSWNWRPCFQSVILIGDHCNDWRRERSAFHWTGGRDWDHHWDGRRWDSRRDGDHRWDGDRRWDGDHHWDGRRDTAGAGGWDGRRDGDRRSGDSDHRWDGRHDGTGDRGSWDGRRDGDGHDGNTHNGDRHDGDSHNGDRWNGRRSAGTNDGRLTAPPVMGTSPDGRRGDQDGRRQSWNRNPDRVRSQDRAPSPTTLPRDPGTERIRRPQNDDRFRGADRAPPTWRAPERRGPEREREGPRFRGADPGSIQRPQQQAPQRIRTPQFVQQRVSAPGRAMSSAPFRQASPQRPAPQGRGQRMRDRQ